MQDNSQVEEQGRGQEADEMVLSWGKKYGGHFDGERRLQRLEVQLQEGQQEELRAPMEQEGQLWQRLDVRAVRGEEEM